MRTLKIVHIIRDDKFYGYFNVFQNTAFFDNIRIYISDNIDYKIKSIPDSDDVIVLRLKEAKRYLKTTEYDVVFLQSMTEEKEILLNYIPKGRKVIWWSYGYELYNKVHGLKPLIPINIYKPLTHSLYKSFHNKKISVIKDFFKEWVLKYFYSYSRNKMLERIDYFQPVIPIEYNLLQRHKSFHAMEFYPPQSYNYVGLVNVNKKANGNILIGNSCTYSNNHLDIISYVKDYIPSDRKVFFPLSYGDIPTTALTNELSKSISNPVFLLDFVPKEQYFNMIDNCSYFISGVLRQQSMGNISYCLSKGIKVFLFRESIVYNYLIKAGFVVFAIEDVDKNSFISPLSSEELIQNRNAIENRKTRQDMISKVAIESLMEGSL